MSPITNPIDDLETRLREATRITWSDRKKAVFHNLNKNHRAIGLIATGSAIFGAGILTAVFNNTINQEYLEAHRYLTDLHAMLDIAHAQGLSVELSPANLEKPLELIRQGATSNYSAEAFSIFRDLRDHSALFSPDSASALAQYLQPLNERLSSIAGEGARAVQGAIRGILGGLGGIVGVMGILQYELPYSWNAKGVTASKRELSRRLDREWNGIRATLEHHPYRDAICEIAVQQIGLLERKHAIVDNIYVLMEHDAPKDALAFEHAVRRAPQLLRDWEVRNHFDAVRMPFDAAAAAEGIVDNKEKPWGDNDIANKLYERFQDEYLVRTFMSTLQTISEPSLKKRFEAAIGHEDNDARVVDAIMEFYAENEAIPPAKRLRMLEYALSTSHQTVENLGAARLQNEYLKYIGTLDELPSVGVKGQVQTFLKLDEALDSIEGRIRQDLLGGSEELQRIRSIMFRRTNVDASIVDFVRFIERHPDVDHVGAIGKLIDYYAFTQGKPFESGWLQREKKPEEPAHVPPPTTRRSARKLVNELERKTRYAQFLAFDSAIDDIKFRELDDILGERVRPNGGELSEDLKRAITGYNRLESAYHELMRPLLKSSIELPGHLEEDRRRFAENLLIDTKIGRAIVTPWREGLTRQYHVSTANGKTEETGTERITLYDSKDFIETLQMGTVTHSCYHITEGANAFAAVINAVDANKKTIYLVNEEGARRGRTLLILTDQGIIAFKQQDNTNLNTAEAWIDYLATYATRTGVPLIVPEYFVDETKATLLLERGAKKKRIKATMAKAVGDEWYDDAGDGRITIPAAGYVLRKEAYVLG